MSGIPYNHYLHLFEGWYYEHMGSSAVHHQLNLEASGFEPKSSSLKAGIHMIFCVTELTVKKALIAGDL